MAQVPIAENLFTWPSDSPRLVGSRCERCDARAYPVQSGCARCGSMDLATTELPQTATLWTWTSQEFLPKSPPYAGPETEKTFVPYFLGYVEMEEKLFVESRLVGFENRLPQIGEELELVVIPFRTDDDGTEVMISAFAPLRATERGGNA